MILERIGISGADSRVLDSIFCLRSIRSLVVFLVFMRKFTPSASVTYHLNQLKLALGDGGGLFDMVHSLRLGQWVWVKICVTRTGLHYTDRMIVTKDIMVEYAIRIGIWLGSLLAIFIYRTCEGLQSLI